MGLCTRPSDAKKKTKKMAAQDRVFHTSRLGAIHQKAEIRWDVQPLASSALKPPSAHLICASHVGFARFPAKAKIAKKFCFEKSHIEYSPRTQNYLAKKIRTLNVCKKQINMCTSFFFGGRVRKHSHYARNNNYSRCFLMISTIHRE